MDQQAAQVRVTDDLFFDGVSPLGIGVGDFEAQRRAAYAVQMCLHMATLVMEECLPVCHQVLNIADLRGVDGGVVNLGDHAIGDGVPDAAGHGVSGADCVLRSARPPRRNPRTMWRWTYTRHDRLSLD